MTASRISRSTGVWAYLGLAFGGAWACLFVARLGFGLSLDNPMVQLPFAFCPAIAAVVVRRWVTREGFGDAGLRPRIATAPGFYVLAWLGPLMIAGATIALAALFGYEVNSTSPASDLPLPVFLVLLTVALPLLAPVYWGEEFGWTGYLRQRLLPGRPLRAAVVTGLIWALWHYPLAFLGYIDYGNVAVGLLTWTFVLVLQEIILTWLRIRGGSIWTASLAHAGNNMVIFLLVGTTVTSDNGPLDPAATDLLVAAPMALLCLGIVLAGSTMTAHRRSS